MITATGTHETAAPALHAAPADLGSAVNRFLVHVPG